MQENILLYAKLISNTFQVSPFSGIITGYKSERYPENLEPELIPYHCQPGN